MLMEDLQEDPEIKIDFLDNLEIIFNDATGLFKSEDGKRINFGEIASWKLSPRTINSSKVSNVDILASLWLVLAFFTLTIAFVLAIFQGSLVPSWHLINTLQLIVHIPLISDQVPANAYNFLLNFLGLSRLSFAGLGSSH